MLHFVPGKYTFIKDIALLNTVYEYRYCLYQCIGRPCVQAVALDKRQKTISKVPVGISQMLYFESNLSS